MDFQGGQWKKIENSRGVTVNFTGNPEGSTSKKSISSTGGFTIFFLEKPNDIMTDNKEIPLMTSHSFNGGHLLVRS